MSKCRNTSIMNCIKCKSYDCKNLYEPIKINSCCYEMIKNKLFDECVFGCENESDLNGCCHCKYRDVCSTLIGESVAFMN